MKTFVFTAFLLCITALTALAQTNTGRLIGTVSGPDGVLPGATVTVIDNRTNIERTVVTNDQGGFTVPQLEVGTYTVRISANGFNTSEQREVVINVAQEYTLNVALVVGDVNATVTVTAGEDIINASNPELSRTVSSRQIQELPLNGRNPLQLTLLQAGTSSNPSQNTVINGFRTSSSNIVQDGINVQDNFIRSNATDFSPGRATVDNVEQFTISTQSGADRGFGGPQIELVTPRGGNRLTGALFLYNRNSALAANNFFNNSAGQYQAGSFEVNSGAARAGQEIAPRPFLNRNQFGGRVAGPILKDKLFFFGYYEGLRLRQDVPTNNITLTDTARQGIFRYIDDANNVRSVSLFPNNLGLPILPLAAAPTGNPNTVAPTAINPAVQSLILSRLPTGNFSQLGDGLNTIGYRFNRRVPQNRNQYTTRFDYNFNETNNINAVFDYAYEDLLRNDADTSFNVLPTIIQPGRNTRSALAYRTSPSSNFTNEVRGGIFFSRPVFFRTEDNPAFFIIPTLVTTPFNTFQNQGRYTKTFNIQDTADLIFGNHSLRFGGQFQRVNVDAFNDAGIVPTYNIGTSANSPQITGSTAATAFPGGITRRPAQRNTANALYALLGGIIGSGTQTFNSNVGGTAFTPGGTNFRDLNYNIVAPFVNDTWRVTPSLTLTLGLRYDYYGPLKSDSNLYLEPKINDLNNPLPSLLDPNGTYQRLGTNVGKAGQFYRSDNNNFAPVVGFAYSPDFGKNYLGRAFFGEKGRTVIRGGFRLSYINDELVRAPDNAIGGNAGFNLANNAFFTNSAGNTSISLDSRVGGSLPAISPQSFNVTGRTFTQNNVLAGNFGTVFAVDPNLETPRVLEYSLSFARELPLNLGFEVRYVGTSSTNLLRTVDFNQVDIFGNGFLDDFNRARANYLLTNNAACTSAGCQPLTVFPRLANPLLTNGTVINNLINGTPADLAVFYIQNGLVGTIPAGQPNAGQPRVSFLPNYNAGVVNILENGAFTRYNSLQAELRRRFSNGVDFQANYTFSKALTNAIGTGQTRVEPFLDNRNQSLDISRADFDQTHVFNFNANYELPFGKGKRFFNEGGFVNQLLGGIQLTSIVRVGSGAPITFTDARGTLNRAARSGRQTALTNLNKDQLKSIAGVYKTRCGVFFLNPANINLNQAALNSGDCANIRSGATGRGANGFGSATFEGQIFFNNAPGQTSGLERAVVNGPRFLQVDSSLIKNFAINERTRFQFRGEVFNIFNTNTFVPPQFIDINSSNFGQITLTGTNPRIIQLAGRLEF